MASRGKNVNAGYAEGQAGRAHWGGPHWAGQQAAATNHAHRPSHWDWRSLLATWATGTWRPSAS